MSDVDDYVSKVDPKLRGQFAKLRLMIKKAMPNASESVKWGVPYYSLNGVGVASVAEYSQHVNLYFMQDAKLVWSAGRDGEGHASRDGQDLGRHQGGRIPAPS